MAPLLTLITCLVGAALAVGYACEAGLRFWRRAAACVLALALAAGAGLLLMAADPTLAYVVGIPSLLTLGAIMLAPERCASAPAIPQRRASDRMGRRSSDRMPQPKSAARWRTDRRASRRRTAPPLLSDTSGPHHTGSVTQLTPAGGSGQIGRASTVTRSPGRAAAGDPRSTAEAVLAARRHHSRRGTPRSLSRMSRCRYR